MAIATRVTRMVGTLVNVAKVRVTRMGAALSGSVGVRVTRMRATSASVTGVRVTRMKATVTGSSAGPVLAVGPAQTVLSGAFVQLTASAVATGATIATWTWRLVGVSGSQTPVLSATNVREPTFNAPPGMKEYTATFGVKVTDSLGRTSAESTVVITVRKADLIFADVSGWKRPGTFSYPVAGGWG